MVHFWSWVFCYFYWSPIKSSIHQVPFVTQPGNDPQTFQYQGAFTVLLWENSSANQDEFAHVCFIFVFFVSTVFQQEHAVRRRHEAKMFHWDRKIQGNQQFSGLMFHYRPQWLLLTRSDSSAACTSFAISELNTETASLRPHQLTLCVCTVAPMQSCSWSSYGDGFELYLITDRFRVTAFTLIKTEWPPFCSYQSGNVAWHATVRCWC